MRGRLPATSDPVAVLVYLEPKLVPAEIGSNFVIQLFGWSPVLPDLYFKFSDLSLQLCGMLACGGRLIARECYGIRPALPLWHRLEHFVSGQRGTRLLHLSIETVGVLVMLLDDFLQLLERSLAHGGTQSGDARECPILLKADIPRRMPQWPGFANFRQSCEALALDTGADQKSGLAACGIGSASP